MTTSVWYSLPKVIEWKWDIAMRALTEEEIKHTELDILLELDSICSQHGISYLIAYGTALGAARHKGFIPWDDDIDVMMPREDYERLYRLFREDRIGSNLILTTYRDKSSIYSFFKLTDPRTFVRESYLREEYSSGLWIDIFPIERASSISEAKIAWRYCSRRLFIKAQRVANPDAGTSMAAILAKRALIPISLLFSPYKLAESIDRRAAKLDARGAVTSASPTLWASMDDTSSEKCTYSNDLLFPGRMVEFEGHQFPAPHKLDEYLTHCYGDWHRLPPESERRPHFVDAYQLDD